MDTNTDNQSTQLHNDLQSLTHSLRALAKNHHDDPMAMLAILRTLEGLHQELREGLFQQVLPDNRQALYNLLKDIEAKGGWPYIPRLRLRYILENWSDEDL
ncbi:MAG: hypothetical protein F6K24_07830 [Okeania sp. SIO2D1]|uniref:hypothetical protein n=1 Tax=Okeania sp. SIO2C9 TaxID=2607791 RepID=UPI0013BA90A4|nr:hypothetical protein [Okeania sp. SIO2C9]NEQ77745.1 hypothetical protein [Okeania sp. SIO2C9]NES65167.1 hypothetical protein [Okeania sp. SIO2D1]